MPNEDLTNLEWTEVGSTDGGARVFFAPLPESAVSPLDVSGVQVSDESLARMREQTARITRLAAGAVEPFAEAAERASGIFSDMWARMNESLARLTPEQAAMIGPPSAGRITRADVERGLSLAFSRPFDAPASADPHDVSNIDEALRCFNWRNCGEEDQGLGWCSEVCHQVFLRQHYGALHERPTDYPDVAVNAPELDGDPHGPGGEAHWSAPRDHPERETSRRPAPAIGPNWLEGESGVQPTVLAVDETHQFLREEQVVIGPPWHGRPARRSTEGQPGVEGPQQELVWHVNLRLRAIVDQTVSLVMAQYPHVWVGFQYDQMSNSLRCSVRNGRAEVMRTWPMEEIEGHQQLPELLRRRTLAMARDVLTGI